MKKKVGSESVFSKDLREVKTAGFKATKREKNVNRRAGLHDKKNKAEGVTRVKRSKPLALKHVRRMRKVALAFSCVFVGCVAAVGVGFFTKGPIEDLPEVDYATVCYETPTDGSDPTAHTLVENVGYMNYVLQNQPFWSSEMQSTVFTVMQQRVYTYKQFYNGVLISADIAQGVSSEATQFCVTDEVVLWRSAANKNFDGMNTPWSTKEAQGLTISQFKQKRGLPPSEFSVYILNEKTIKNALDYSVTLNADGNYTMTLDLNVNTGDGETSADYFYKQQMLVTGGLDEHPVISETQVTYVFDKDWQILSFTIRDSYNAKMGISVHCTSETNTTFSYKEEDAVNSFYEDYFKQYENNFVAAPDPDTSEPNALNYLAAAFGSVLSDGATFKIDLSVGELDLGGVVHVGLSDGALSDVRVNLGDIGVYVDNDLTLFVTDGKAKYKLGLKDMLGSSDAGEGGDALAGLDVNEIVDMLAGGTFTADGDRATLESNLEVFGLQIALKFEFNTANGIELGFVAAEIPFNGQLIKARLEYGSPEDIPQIPADLDEYADVFKDGISFDISLALDGLELSGVAQIVMDNDAFAGVRAELGEFGVYYDCPTNMLYLTDGKSGFKFSLAALGGNGIELGALDLNPVLSQIIENITTGEGTLSTRATLEILEQTITAALGVKLTGGIEINADLELYGKKITATVGLSNESVALPDFSQYVDVLNDGITLNVSLALDGITLDGAIYIGVNDGKFTELRADFGEIKVYYLVPDGELYLSVGTIKAMVALGNTEDAHALDIPALLGGEVPAILGELLGNLTAALKEVSTSANITLLDSVIPAKLALGFEDGIKVSAEVSLLGITASLEVSIGENGTVPELSDKDEYINVLEEGWELVDTMLGEKVTASVKGSISERGSEKYAFNATLEYDKGYTLDENGEKVVNGFPVHINTGVVENGVRTGVDFYIDSTLYLHFNLLLEAKTADSDSLYLDMYLMDATPVSSTNGRTDGGYVADGKLDVYISVSKYAPSSENFDPLMLYAPVDEIMTLVSMVASAANLDNLEFKDNEALTAAASEISNIVHQLLIDKYIPHTKDQFASLGDSLIPQIFNGLSLNEILNRLLTKIDENVDEAEERGMHLDAAYIKSVTHGDDSLKLVLDASVVYGAGFGEESDVVVELNRGTIDGVKYLTDARINNIFFGDENEQKLDLAATLSYDDIAKPAEFKSYLNLDGIDTLIKSLINSATHEVDGDASYDLNHYYLLNGSVTAQISVIGIKINATIQIKSLAVYIDENNEVSIDAHIYYKGVQEVNQIAIDGDTDVYLSIKGDRIIIKRVKYNHYVQKTVLGITTTDKVDYNPALEESRSMTLKEFSENLMDNITFIFSFGPVITDNISGSDSSGSGVSFDGYDFGKSLNSILASYNFEETATGASWTVSICGSLLSALTGMTTTDIPVKISANLNSDGTYTVTKLEILSSTMNLFGSVAKLNFWGDLTYCNPHEVMSDGYSDTSKNLFELRTNVVSAFDTGYPAEYVAEYGSQIYLPLYVTVKSNGQIYMLNGYEGCTIESCVEIDGVTYGAVTVTDNTVITAIWDKAYTVKYLGADGEELYSVVYTGGHVLDFVNMPACPELDGYIAEWVTRDGNPAFGMTVNADMTFTVRYTKTSFKVTLNSTVDFGYSGFDGSYKQLNLGFDEGADYTVADATAAGYVFLGWWYNDDGQWRKITSVEEFAASGEALTLEALWLKVNIDCVSTKDSYRKNAFSTLYYYYYFECELTYGFEGNGGLIDGITCTATSFRMYVNNDGAFSATDSNLTMNFEGYQNKLEQQKIELKDSWGSANKSHWNIVATLSFDLPDGTAFTVPQTDVHVSGSY